MSHHHEGGIGLKHMLWSVVTVFTAFMAKDYLFKATWKTATGDNTKPFLSTLFEVVDDDVHRRQRTITPTEKHGGGLLEKLKATPLLDLR